MLGGSATVAPNSPPTPASLAVRRFTRTLDRDWTRTSYTGLARAAAEHEAQDPDRLRSVTEPEDPPRADEPPLPDTGAYVSADGERILSPMAELPVGATFGSLVHAVLEHADPDQAADDDAWRAQLRRLVDEQRVWWPVDLDRRGPHLRTGRGLRHPPRSARRGHDPASRRTPRPARRAGPSSCRSAVATGAHRR